MRPFTKADGLPKDLSHWQETVDQMLYGIDAPGPIYIMIDQSEVRAGDPQRRPGVHIDGYWNPGINAHGGSHRGHRIEASSWDTSGHIIKPSAEKEAIILASDVSACRALHGEFNGEIGDGGDCSGLDLRGLVDIRMQPYTTYAGNVTMLHESLPVEQDCRRTLVRLNVPGWTPQ